LPYTEQTDYVSNGHILTGFCRVNMNAALRGLLPCHRLVSSLMADKKWIRLPVTQEELTMIENRLNHRPRKRLKFKTPYEVSCFVKTCAVRT